MKTPEFAPVALPAATGCVVESDQLSLTIDQRGIGWLTFAQAATHLTPELFRALDSALGAAEEGLTAGTLRAIVFRAQRGNPFLLGERLEELLSIPDAAAAERLASAAQRTLRRLEQLPIPTIAAIEGACLGAGLELALACSYRVSSSAPTARFALPQVRLGMIPGFGATVRLPRLVGLQESIRLILTTEPVGSVQAHEIGLLDSVIPAASFDQGVEAFVLERVKRGRMRTGARRRIVRRVFEDTAPGRRLLFSRAARGLIPALPFPRSALQRALQSIGEGISLPLDRAFQHEAELYGELVAGEEARSLMHVSLLAGDLRKEPEALTVRGVAVLGAGIRGAELAYLLAHAGIPVRLKDRKRSAVTAGVQAVRDRLSPTAPERPAAGSVEQTERLVSGASGFGGFGTDDLVLAAVGDRPPDVRLALGESERHSSESCLLATTSPFVRVEEVQSVLRQPARALGLVFTSPVELFPVMEIVPGAQASPEAIATARHLARRLGCTPVVVLQDRPGFLVHRLLAVHLAEATRLVDEGVGIEDVDAAMEEYGLRMGPLFRIDVLGTERVTRLFERLGEEIGEGGRPGVVLSWLYERSARFYRYRKGRATRPNPEVVSRFPEVHQMEASAIRERILLTVLKEASVALELGVVQGAGAVDLAAISGLGYPATRGGPLYQADRIGLPVILTRMEALSAVHGERFAPTGTIRKLAGDGETFYGARDDAGQAGRASLQY